MKKFLVFLSSIAVMSLMFSLIALAQDAGVIPPSGDEFAAFFAALGGVKGMSALAISSLVIQGIMLFIRASAGEMLGKHRLSILLGLSAAYGVLKLILGGSSVGAALVATASLAAYQVFFNQLYKQYFVKKD